MGSQSDSTEAAEHPHKTDNRDVLCSPGNYVQLFVIMEKNLKKHVSISIHTHMPELLSVQLKLAQHCKLITLKIMVKKAEGLHSHKIPLGSRDCVVGILWPWPLCEPSSRPLTFWDRQGSILAPLFRKLGSSALHCLCFNLYPLLSNYHNYAHS